MRPRLPIDEVLEPMLEHLAPPGRNAVLIAPPGAGKTTCLPAALLDRLSSDEGEIIVAQPRRIAARMAAQIVARWRGQELGDEVGYRVRFDSKAGPKTRLTFVTEGVLLRRLRDDPQLAGVSALIFDEIHERHLPGDLALALARRCQLGPRPQLRIVTMSATLEPGPLGDYLEAPTFSSEGRAFEVHTENLVVRKRPLEAQVLRAVQAEVERAPSVDVAGLGHILIFLPGAAEIRRCSRALAGFCDHHRLTIRPLYASLAHREQELAIESSDRPKVILATNVAETSLTIDQVATVIDSGLARVARHDPGAGLPRLELQPISRASAIQRAGRAGRTRPGRCVRLYARADFDRRPERDRPEVARADLCDGVFDLALAGIDDPLAFSWFEAPPLAALQEASALLRRLGAIDDEGVTELGRKMGPLPLHPRLSCAWVHAQALGVGELACAAVAILAERELRRPDSAPEHHDLADPIYELERIRAARGASDRLRRAGIDPRAAEAVERARRALSRKRPKGEGKHDRLSGAKAHRALSCAFLAAFSDRLGRVRARGEQLELLGIDGRAVPLSTSCVVRDEPFALLLRAQSRQQGTRRVEQITAACAVQVDDILDACIDEISEHTSVDFDAARKRVVAFSELRIGELVLERSAMARLPPEAAQRLFEEVKNAGLKNFIDLEALLQLQNRARFVRESFDEAFIVIDEGLVDLTLREICEGKHSFAELRQENLLDRLRAKIGAQLSALDRLAPTSVTLAGGRRLSVDYTPGRGPSVASFLQDFFGAQRGPSIADGRVALTLHLRAPNRRDVQVTTDLSGFWERHYPDIRKQLKRRYPRHDWPEDPTTAKPPAPRPRRGPRKKNKSRKKS